MFAHLAAALILAALPENVRIVIPERIGLSAEQVSSRLEIPPLDPDRGFDSLEIVIYHFSTGKESISLGEEGTLRETSHEGGMKALVKLKRKGALVRVFFIQAVGRDIDVMCRRLSKKLTSIIEKGIRR